MQVFDRDKFQKNCSETALYFVEVTDSFRGGLVD